MLSPILFVAVTLALLSGMSLRAEWRLRTCRHLPVQWGQPRKSGWRAPRTIALSLTPAFASATLTLALFPVIISAGGVPVPYRLGIAVACTGFVLWHAAYLASVSRTAVVATA